MKTLSSIAFALILISPLANAAEKPEDGCTYRWCVGEVDFLYTHAAGDSISIQMKLPNAELSNLECELTQQNKLQIDLDLTKTLSDKVYDVLLQALIHSQTVLVRTNTDGKACTVQYVKIFNKK